MDGWIEAIFGPMFSGKTEELLKRVHRAAWGRQRVQVVVPHANTRWEGAVRSHAGAVLEAHPCIAVTVVLPGVDLVIGEGVKVLAFDEAQFFDPRDLVRWVLFAASQGLRVIVAALDRDSQGEPFGAVREILFHSDEVTKTSAICVVCSRPATRTQRLTPMTAQVEVGAADKYEARCKFCHRPDVSETRAA